MRKLLTVLALLPSILLAQNNPLEGSEFMLEQDRIEDVIESKKPEIFPPSVLPPKKHGAEELQFESKEVYIPTDFKPAPPKMLPLTREAYTVPENNYAKLGFGRYATPLLKVYFANGEKEDTRYGVDFTHLSAHKDTLALRNFREDYGSIWGNMNNKQVALGGKASFYNTAYWHYGDTITPFASEAIRKDSLRMGFTQIDLRGSVSGSERAYKQFRYYVPVGVKIYSDQYTNREVDMGINPQFTYQPAEKFSFQLSAAANSILGKIGDTTTNRSTVDMVARINYVQSNRLWISGGYRYGFFRNRLETAGLTLHVPLAEVRYALRPEQLILTLGVTGGMQHLRYHTLITENRFLADSVQMNATMEKFNLYAGASGNLRSKFNYQARVFYRQVANQPIYYAAPNNAYFSVIYDSLTKNFGINLEGNYIVQDRWTTGLTIRYNHFSTQDTALRVYQVAPLYVEFNGSMQPVKNLNLRAAIFVYGSTPMGRKADGSTLLRGPVPDINLAADYRFSRRFSVWAEANNLFNVTYYRWINYLERPLDYKIGVSVSF